MLRQQNTKIASEENLPNCSKTEITSIQKLFKKIESHLPSDHAHTHKNIFGHKTDKTE